MVGGHLGCAEFTCSGTYLATDGNFPEPKGQLCDQSGGDF
jgi:hypothetical protein